MKNLLLAITALLCCCFAQHSDESGRINQLQTYEDSLTTLGKQFINDDNEMDRKNANYAFIKTLVNAEKYQIHFYPFDS